MKSGIYKITNKDTNKFYIGSAIDIDWRWTLHRRELRANRHCNPKLQHSWNYHGEDKFSISILEEIENPNQIKLFEREQYYLDTFKPYEREIGYNIGSKAIGGDNITHHPNREAFIEKMKIITMGENNGMYGREHSSDAIKEMKVKAEGRYTLDWFVNRYGKREGKNKYYKRKKMLSNRKINHIYDNGQRGKSKGIPSILTRERISQVKEKMITIKSDLIKDIKSEKYTIKQLCEKYDIGPTAVKYNKAKLKKEEVI